MDKFLADLCEKHLLTAITVARDNEAGRVGVSLHWGRLGYSFGAGITFDEAMNQALAGMVAQEAA